MLKKPEPVPTQFFIWRSHAWATWEATTIRLVPDPELIAEFSEHDAADSLARIESHYFMNGGFFDHPGQQLDNVSPIRHIPAVIVHGRYDMCCPMTNAWDLHRRWPEAALEIVADPGHAGFEPGIVNRLIEATDRFGILPT